MRTTRIGLASVGLAFVLGTGGAQAAGNDQASCLSSSVSPAGAKAACTSLLSRKDLPARTQAAAHACRAQALSRADEGDGGAADFARALGLSKDAGGLLPEAECLPGGDVALAVCRTEEFKGFDFMAEACGQVIGRVGDANTAGTVAALRIRATASLEAGYQAEAFADLDRAVALDPADPELRFLRSRLLFNRGRLQQAAGDLRIAIDGQPEDGDRRQRLVQALLYVGDLDGALAASNDLVATRPLDAISYLERARVEGIRADVPAAIADLRKAGTLDATYADWQPYREMVLDRAAWQLGRIIDLKLGAETNPLFRLRAEAYGRRGELANALADFDQALAFKPDDVVALAGRADVKMRRLDFEGGLADFRLALAISDETAAAQGNEAERARETAREIVAEFGTRQTAGVGIPKAMR